MISIQLHMPDVGLAVMKKSWEGARPLYQLDQQDACCFGDLLDKIKAANDKHGVLQRHTPDFLRPQRLSRNEVAYLLRYALTTWKSRHKQVTQKMLAWAVDIYSDFLPALGVDDKRQAIGRIGLQAGESFKDPTLQKRAPYELEKAQRNLAKYQGDSPVEFMHLLIREVDEAMQRAHGNTGMSLSQLFRR
jgi:hypothetical protein